MIIIEDINDSANEQRQQSKYCLIYATQFTPTHHPLGMGHIAAELKKAGIRYNFYTIIANGNPELDEWVRDQEFDAYLFSIYDWNILTTKRIIEKIRKYHRNKKIIVGGCAGYAYGLIFKQLEPDFIVVGEGEEPIIKLIDAIENNKEVNTVPSIAYKRNDEIILNKEHATQDINKLASPYIYDVFNKRYYKQSNSYMFTRGCIFKCTYCLWGSPKSAGTFRVKDVNLALSELKILWHNGVREIKSQDAIFNFSTEYLKNIEENLSKRGIKFRWADADCRADFIDEEQVRIMKKLGVIEVGLGLETTNQQTQKTIKKFLDPKKVEEAVKILRKNNIKVHISFQIGLPGETEEDAKKTFEFVKKLNPDEAGIFHTRLQPGTELYETMDRYDCTNKEIFGCSTFSKNNNIDIKTSNSLIEEFYKNLQKISTKRTLLINNEHHPYKLTNDGGELTLTMYLREIREEDSLKGINENTEDFSKIKRIVLKTSEKTNNQDIQSIIKRMWPNATVVFSDD
ncbi:MAG: radical SAM protein [Candidatus Aenigmatarchaeota archaeon]